MDINKIINEEVNKILLEEMFILISEELVSLPDGTYDALWSNFKLKILSNNGNIEIKTINEVQGKNLKLQIKILEHKVYYK